MKILFHLPTQTLRAYPRQDDEPVVGLSADFEIFEVVQEDEPEYNSVTHHLEPTETINTETKTVLRGWAVVANSVVPITVTRAALKMALGQAVCSEVDAWIAAISDATAQFQARTWWTEAPSVRQNHPVVEQFRIALGRSTAEVDAWFQTAKIIDQG